MIISEATEDEISRHLQEWFSATQRSPINKNVSGFLKIASPALNVLAQTRVAAFIYDYKHGNYSYFNDFFPELMNCTREHIEEVGIEVMKERVHPEDFIKCLNVTRRSLEEFSRMKEMEQLSTQLRLFFRLKQPSGDYVWVMQSNRQVRWSKDAPSLDLAYIVELFAAHNPIKVMGILKTNSREIEIFPDGNTELISKLTSREMEVLKLISVGLSTKDVAEKLSISIHTVKSHRKHLIRKLYVKNMVQAMGILEKAF